MRVYELAYCCRLYGEGTGYDVALARFLEGTGGAVDLDDVGHRALLLQWLRDWGCRSLRREDDERSSEALRAWWEEWGDSLPAPGMTLGSIDDDRLATASEAYGALAQRNGPRRQLSGRLIDVRFGPTTAAKAMYAVRPEAFLPWDDAIRKRLGYGEDVDSYRRALVRARSELEEAAQDAGIDPDELPAFIRREQSTPPKLVDEHDWVRYTLGHEPPARQELERWLGWA